jgi:hypothetical protein
MSFIVVPLKGDTVKMHTVLHSIVLLNGQFSKVRQRENKRRAVAEDLLLDRKGQALG